MRNKKESSITSGCIREQLITKRIIWTCVIERDFNLTIEGTIF